MVDHHIFGEQNIEPKALAQFYDAIKQPFVEQAALMPDAHLGYSLPIGAVVATRGVVLPAWVGYDVGCGVCAMPTTFRAEDVACKADDIFTALYARIPVGFAHNDQPTVMHGLPEPSQLMADIMDSKRGLHQLGSLGGGNHFLEIGVDISRTVWVVVHSGSRGVGHATATHYMSVASPDGKPREGHFGFEVQSQLGQDYLRDMEFCLRFALLNRLELVQRACAVLRTVLQAGEPVVKSMINRNHNHAEMKGDLCIHRKGATHAEAGMMGVVPGNMRDGSFIVRGKGDPRSLSSCSHGAGRMLGRAEAKRQLNLEDMAAQMAGVTATVTSATLDEHPDAYKNIFQVMGQQQDLVQCVAHVVPIINVKG